MYTGDVILKPLLTNEVTISELLVLLNPRRYFSKYMYFSLFVYIDSPLQCTYMYQMYTIEY